MINSGSEFSQEIPTHAGVYVSRQELLSLRHRGKHSQEIQTRRNRSTLTGEILSAIKGHGIEFTDIRPYQPGDEVRHMDWRTSARTGKLHTREYNEEKLQTVYLGVDQRISMFFGSGTEFKSVTSARIAAIIAWAAADRGFQLGATVVGEIPDSTKGADDRNVAAIKPEVNTHYITSIRNEPSKQTTLTLINELAIANNALSANCAETPVGIDIKAHKSSGLNTLLERTLAHQQTGSTIYLISDFCGFNNESVKSLTALGRKSRVVLILVSDPLEEQLPDSGTVGISDGQLHRNIRLNTRQQIEYQTLRQCFLSDIQHCAVNTGAQLLRSHSSDSVSTFDNSYRAANHHS